ncbi:3'(2'),5'-bisphosphate nucleotidase CysQ [Sphingomonas sp. LY54]|uniref:3'(2'),5'-bisphosphate nucleotidase CysQ n=1 Tax=Sphingomonas sp. LY54 TaxID=3095343 RepID=UPI002D781BA1|nr:3'(2'),5'-bisphosphate nucleotidase CysQ [Sphingomonas sp. LY54]WRP28214.1 3'(2'),5'-bisphosphate nucleotidase CysQ [Sphingomonas sp. LY54]
MTQTQDAELAAQLAETAGRILLALQSTPLLGPATLGKAGDAVANQFLMRALGEQRPDDAILSEEGGWEGARLGKSRVWIIDPLDGTREYGEGRCDWAVHVGLAVDGEATLGAVALPRLGVTLRSDAGIVAGPEAEERRPRVVVSRTRPASQAVALADALGAELAEMGSAGAKAMAVVRGEADFYLHSGGQYEWDSCAPVAVALAHGLHCSRIDGSPLRYNQPDSYLPDLLVCRKQDAARLLGLLEAMA